MDLTLALNFRMEEERNTSCLNDIDPRCFWTLSPSREPEIDNDFSESEVNDADIKKNKKNKKLSVAEKHDKFRQEEEKIRSIEEELSKSALEPKSPEDCERLLLAKPHNTDVWIAYMSLHLQATEIEKARAVAKRALDTFSFIEDKKLEIWFALLNMESKFGDSESLETTFDAAVRKNDPLTICKIMTDILISEKKNDLSKLISFMLRCKSHNSKIYKLMVKACDEHHLTTEEKAFLQSHLKSDTA